MPSPSPALLSVRHNFLKSGASRILPVDKPLKQGKKKWSSDANVWTHRRITKSFRKATPSNPHQTTTIWKTNIQMTETCGGQYIQTTTVLLTGNTFAQLCSRGSLQPPHFWRILQLPPLLKPFTLLAALYLPQTPAGSS